MDELSNTAIKAIKTFVDSKTDFNVLGETTESLVLTILGKLLNSKVISKMDEEDIIMLDAAIIDIFEDNELSADDMTVGLATLSNILAKYINTPLIDGTPEEAIIINGALEIIYRLAESIVEKVKAKHEDEETAIEE